MNQKVKQSGFKGFLTLFSLLKGNRRLYVLTILILGFTIGAEVAGFMVIRRVVDGLLEPELRSTGIITFLITCTLAFLGLALLKGGLSYLHGWGKAHCSEQVIRRMRNSLYDHMQRLSFSFHDSSQTGELVQRSTSDVDTVRKFFSNQIPELSQVFFQFSINLGILLMLEWRLALFSVIVVPVVGIVSTVFFFRIFDAYDDYQDVEGHMSNRIQENLSGNRVVRAFAVRSGRRTVFARSMLCSGPRDSVWPGGTASTGPSGTSSAVFSFLRPCFWGDIWLWRG